MKKTFLIWGLFSLLFWHGSLLFAAVEDWRNGFEKICAHTADAGNLSGVELSSLIAESDALLKIIEAGNDPDKKLYLVRLKKCRNFFIFMLDIGGKPEIN